MITVGHHHCSSTAQHLIWSRPLQFLLESCWMCLCLRPTFPLHWSHLTCLGHYSTSFCLEDGNNVLLPAFRALQQSPSHTPPMLPFYNSFFPAVFQIIWAALTAFSSLFTIQLPQRPLFSITTRIPIFHFHTKHLFQLFKQALTFPSSQAKTNGRTIYNFTIIVLAFL